MTDRTLPPLAGDRIGNYPELKDFFSFARDSNDVEI
jgi:hypothetical protein